MNIPIINRQKLCRPATARLKKLAGFFLHKALAGGAKKFDEVSLALTDDAGIRPINRLFFNRADATDVISFTLKPLPPKQGLTGEIVINIERALREGRRRRGFAHELALYLAHGCDHLAGNNDRTLKARARMRQRELRWLRQAARKN